MVATRNLVSYNLGCALIYSGHWKNPAAAVSYEARHSLSLTSMYDILYLLSFMANLEATTQRSPRWSLL